MGTLCEYSRQCDNSPVYVLFNCFYFSEGAADTTVGHGGTRRVGVAGLSGRAR